jgi:hypothetical protein
MYIYKITNLQNNKCYIGQSVQTSNVRINNHRYLLRANKHSNPYLQAAWNSYGHNSFVFEKIAFASSAEELDKLEKQLIVEHQSDNREFGYNIFSGGHHQHGVPTEVREKIGKANRGNTHTDEQKQRWAIEKRKNEYPSHILSPDGKLYSVDNIRSFCKTHGIDRGNLIRVLKRDAYHVKGWKLPDTPEELCDNRYITFHTQSKLRGRKLLSPDGSVYSIDKPLTEFCREHNLQAAKIRLVLHGKQSHHRGWKKYD